MFMSKFLCRMYSKLLEQVDYNRVRTVAKTTLTEDPLIPMIEKIVKAADKRKAVRTTLKEEFLKSESYFLFIGINKRIQSFPAYRSNNFYGYDRRKQQTAESSYCIVDRGSVCPFLFHSNALYSIYSFLQEDIKVDFDGKSPISKEGSATSGWILLDYGIQEIFDDDCFEYKKCLHQSYWSVLGSVIIHVMTPQMRNFYKIEKRWKDAEVCGLNNLTTLDVGRTFLTCI